MNHHTLQTVSPQMTLIGPSKPVEHPPKGVTLLEIQTQAPGYMVEVSQRPNTYGPAAGRDDKYATWESAIKTGIMNFADANTTVEAFVAERKISLKSWMKVAYQWARQNPDKILLIGNDRYDWIVYQRGEYVTFELPYHNAGGEKEYVTRDGNSRVQISKD